MEPNSIQLETNKYQTKKNQTDEPVCKTFKVKVIIRSCNE